MKKLPGILILLLITGCGSVGTESLPKYVSFNSLDGKSAEFIREVPEVDINSLPKQSLRTSQQLRDHEVMVSVSGGGARAAAFALGVLAELENLGDWTTTTYNINALDEIDYFSTVSGGGWGVASYLSDRYKSKHDSEKYSLSNRLPKIKVRFEEYSKNKDDCLMDRLNKITNQMKFGNIFIDTGSPELPYLFSIATILPSQAPFVFSEQFIKHYGIDHFYTCGNVVSIDASQGFKQLDISYAIATSGSVPAFYHSTATTKICEDTNYSNSFYCYPERFSGENYDKMILADGGVYDNYGYLTGTEILRSLNTASKVKKVHIVIDSNADTDIDFVNERNSNSLGEGGDVLFKLGFPARTSTFNRFFKPMSKSMGITPLVIDFYSVANFISKSNHMGDKNVLEGLTILKEYTENEISCFSDSGRYLSVDTPWWKKLFGYSSQKMTISARKASKECLDNNYYRVGLRHKTTYHVDNDLFDVSIQLGRLAVRLNADKIYSAIYDKSLL